MPWQTSEAIARDSGCRRLKSFREGARRGRKTADRDAAPLPFLARAVRSWRRGPMPTERKIQAVQELTDVLSRSTVVIGADYRGLKVAEATALRRQLREAGIEMHVVKNTLFRRAAEAAGKQDLAQL